MTATQSVLRVYEAGKLTVLGFGGKAILTEINIAGVRDEIVEVLDQYECEVLAFDLTGVKFLPSGLLGLLASLNRKGMQVHLYNPSQDVREALAVTKLATILEVHEVEFDYSAEGESTPGRDANDDAKS
jgi:anti-sigma B factor antagonist